MTTEKIFYLVLLASTLMAPIAILGVGRGFVVGLGIQLAYAIIRTLSETEGGGFILLIVYSLPAITVANLTGATTGWIIHAKEFKLLTIPVLVLLGQFWYTGTKDRDKNAELSAVTKFAAKHADLLQLAGGPFKIEQSSSAYVGKSGEVQTQLYTFLIYAKPKNFYAIIIANRSAAGKVNFELMCATSNPYPVEQYKGPCDARILVP
jgi:hypothetical protein